MAVNPVHTSRTTVKKMNKGAMLMKDNKLSNQLIQNAAAKPMMKFGQKGSLNEFVKTHDLSQNLVMKRAPKRATYTDIAGNWIYTGIESAVSNGTATPTWYQMAALNFKIDSIFEDNGYCQVNLGVMPFQTDPYGGTAQSKPGYYYYFPDCYAWYEPATDSIGIFGGWSDKEPLTASKSGRTTYTLTSKFWYTGIGSEDLILNRNAASFSNGTVASGVVNWDNGVIAIDEPFGAIEAYVTKKIQISSTVWNNIISGFGLNNPDDYDMAYILLNYQSLLNQYGFNYTVTTTDSTFSALNLYEDNVFVMPTAYHSFERISKREDTDSVFVGEEFVYDSVQVNEVPVFLYQNATNDTINVWNLWNLSNYPDVQFAIDANAVVNFYWQPVYWEDMTAANEAYASAGYTFTNQFFNFHSTYAPYNQDGVVGYYNTGLDWEDTPAEINAELNEITWNATDVMNVFTMASENDQYMRMAFNYPPMVNNKLTVLYNLTLPEPTETWKLGDVNHDGEVDVTDVSITINYVLGKDYEVFYVEQADLDNDPSKVDVGDISVLIGMVLGK